MSNFTVGDRVRSSTDPGTGIQEQWRGVTGTVTEVHNADVTRVRVDGKHSAGESGITFVNNTLILLEDPGPTESEIADLFRIRPKAPGPDSTLVDLLESIDDALRNGRLMTRANLAFDYLLECLDLRRTDLPAYVADMNRIDEEDQ